MSLVLHKLAEHVAPEDKGRASAKPKETKSIVISCPFCCEAFIRKGNYAVIYGKSKRYHVRIAMNQRNGWIKRNKGGVSKRAANQGSNI